MTLSKRQMPLLLCIVVLLLGYATGLQLGRIAPYATRLHDAYGFGLPTIGLLTSLVTLFVATLAIPASRFIPSFGLVRAIKVGAVIMSLGAVIFAFSESLPFLIVARVIEALGHIITVIAAPAYLATKAPEHLRKIFLALWSSFVPVGFAVSNNLGGALAAVVELRNIWLVYAVVMLAIMLLVLCLPREERVSAPSTQSTKNPAKIVWILVLCFGSYAVLSIGFFTFLPTYVSPLNPQLFSPGVVPLFVPLGSFLAAFTFARTKVDFPPKIIGLGFLTIAIAAVFSFQNTGFDTSLARALFAFANGITAAAIFTSVPVFTRSEEEAAFTIGAIAQAGGLMVLMGAPLAGFILEAGSWAMLGYFFALVAMFAFFSVSFPFRKT